MRQPGAALLRLCLGLMPHLHIASVSVELFGPKLSWLCMRRHQGRRAMTQQHADAACSSSGRTQQAEPGQQGAPGQQAAPGRRRCRWGTPRPPPRGSPACPAGPAGTPTGGASPGPASPVVAAPLRPHICSSQHALPGVANVPHQVVSWPCWRSAAVLLSCGKLCHTSYHARC